MPRGHREVHSAILCLHRPGLDAEAVAPLAEHWPAHVQAPAPASNNNNTTQQHNNTTLADTAYGQGCRVPETGGALPRGGDGKQEEEERG